MGWFTKHISKYKQAGFNYEDTIDPQLRDLYARIKPLSSQYPEAMKILKRIETAIGSWNKNRVSQDPNERQFGHGNAMKTIGEAQRFLMDTGAPQNDRLFRDIRQSKEQGGEWSNFGKDNASLLQSINLVPDPNDPTGQKKLINIKGVRLHPFNFKGAPQINPNAEAVQKEMGDLMTYKDDGKNANIFIQGTQEAWAKFVSIAGWIFANDAQIRKFKFPEPLPTSGTPNGENNAGKKPLHASSISQPPDVSRSKEPIPGIRLMFDVKHPSYLKDFPFIRDYMFQEAGLNPTKTRIYWNQGTIDIFDIKNKDRVSAENLYRLSKKLQDMKYDNVIALNNIIKELTDLSYGKAYEQHSEQRRQKARSVKTTNTALNKNLLPNGIKISSRFNEIKTKMGINPEDPLSQEQAEAILKEAYKGNFVPGPDGKPVGPWGPQNWVGPYGPGTTESQRKAQTEGMTFVSSRVSSVLADQPGSGKTAQAIVGADSTREPGQKILVVTPNVLLRENWTGPDAKGPMYFCGHDKTQIAVVSTAEDVQQAIKDPNIVWVILRESVIKQAGQKSEELVRSISQQASSGVFSSLIIDEIQKYKKMDSVSFGKLQSAVSAYHIPQRIGLTGTPSDNTPDDMFVQLSLLRHRVLMEDKGTENFVTAQNAAGFAEQYLGGAALSEGVTLSRTERQLPPDEQDDLKQTRWTGKAHSVLQWISNLNDERKQGILDLFSNTFLRRDKEDIKPELRDIAPVSEGVVEAEENPEVTAMSQQGKGWHTKAMKASAMAKAPATSEHAIKLLSANPEAKVFIGTQSVEVAQLIARLINQKMGEGCAVAVTGEIKNEDERANIAATFRQKGGALPNAKTPLRCTVYTSDLGAVGLNFNIAQTAILNDLDWNPSVNEQMFDRIDRIDTSHPISKLYTKMPGSYDEEMYKRIQMKRTVNKAMTNLMRSSRSVKDPVQKIKLANEFVKDIIENIVLDMGLSPTRQKWFDENLEKAFRNEPVETWEEMQKRVEARDAIEKRKQPVDRLLPDFLNETPTNRADAEAQEMNRQHWRNKVMPMLLAEFGQDWERMPTETLKEFLHQKEKERLRRVMQEREMVANFIENIVKKAYF